MTSLEERLDFLKSVGIELKPDATIDDLEDEVSLTDYEIEEFKSDAYEQLLYQLGMNFELSNDIWHYDTECIEGPGSYVAIAESLALLSDGALPLEQIEDEVDNKWHSIWNGVAVIRYEGASL